MIKLSPPEYSTVQVERPVIEGGEAFLARAQAVGRFILGEKMVGSVTTFGLNISNEIDGPELEDALLEPVHIDTQVGLPVFETCNPNDLAMVLFHRGAKHELASQAGIHRARRILEYEKTKQFRTIYDNQGRKHRPEIARPSLFDELNQISRDYQKDPLRTGVLFDRVDIIGEPGSSYVVGLFPAAAHIVARALHDQAKAVRKRLEWENSRLARETSPWQLAIPFGRLPKNISDIEYIDVLQELQGLVQPSPVRLVLGEPRSTSP